MQEGRKKREVRRLLKDWQKRKEKDYRKRKMKYNELCERKKEV